MRRKAHTGVRAAALAAAIALALAACSSGGQEPQPTATQQARPASTATVSILEPVPGAMVEAGDVPVKLDLTGGEITDTVSTNLQPDVGHIHLKLDGVTVTLLGSLEEMLPGVAPGEHLLEAEFVAADHGPFNPRVLSTVTFSAR